MARYAAAAGCCLLAGNAFVPGMLGQHELKNQSPSAADARMLAAETVEDNQAEAAWSWASVLSASAALGLMAAVVAPKPADAITAEQFSQLTWSQTRGSGLANRCATIDPAGKEIPVKTGARLVNVCFEPKSFAVETKTVNGMEFVTTRLVTGQTYTIDYVVGSLEPNPMTFKEEDGMDFQAVTVQLPNAQRVPFLFSIKQLVAKGEGSAFKPGFTWGGEFTVPSYRTGGFLDPKGRGMYTGYDQATALPGLQADGKEGQEALFKETNKVYDIGKGALEMEVSKINADLNEIGGVFVSKQPSDTDMGSLAPKTVLLKGIFYGKVVNP